MLCFLRWLVRSVRRDETGGDVERRREKKRARAGGREGGYVFEEIRLVRLYDQAVSSRCVGTWGTGNNMNGTDDDNDGTVLTVHS